MSDRVTFTDRVRGAMDQPDPTRKGWLTLDFGKQARATTTAQIVHPLLTPESVVVLTQRDPPEPVLLLRAVAGVGRATVHADAPAGMAPKGAFTINWWIRP